MFPGESVLRTERAAVVDTVAALDPDDFASGPTLCAQWAPRDVLAHVVGLDSAASDYLRAGVRRANARVVERFRAMSREEVLERARRWAARPAPLARFAAVALLGDLAVHHQDVLRPRGIHRELAAPVARAVYREGALLGARRLLTTRVVPTDGLAPALGRGTPLRGATEALGMWLAGRPVAELAQ